MIKRTAPVLGMNRGPRALVVLCLVGLMASLPQPTRAQSAGLSLGEPVLDIGVLNGDSRFVFGHIQDLAVTPSGAILVLDDQAARLSAFSTDGTFLAQTGRRGGGPQEFVHPASVSTSGNDVFVLDNGQMRIHVYGPPEAGFKLERSIRLSFPLERLCASGGRLFGLGYQGGAPLHEVGPGGEPVRSFGELFVPDTIVSRALPAYLTCVAGERPGLAVATVNLPTVWMYELSGELRWSATLPSFVAGEVKRIPGSTTVRFGTAGGKADLVVSVAQSRDLLVVQWGQGFRGMSSAEDVTSVTTAVFRVADGELIETSETVPRVDFGLASRLYSKANDPFPRVRAYERR